MSTEKKSREEENVGRKEECVKKVGHLGQLQNHKVV